MYTQCEHCKAIFRVNIREVTVAKGKLRCGECNGVFDATSNLSTTMPSTFEELNALSNEKAQSLDDDTNIEVEDIRNSLLSADSEERVVEATPINIETIKKKEKPTKKPTVNWLLISALFLLSLLAAQVYYNNRHLFLGTPLHQPEKIQMLNHNIFAHPNESGVLLISALIENIADHAQPYPALELRLENSQSELVAFRRFLPKEYLFDYTKGTLIQPKTPVSLKLKIKDPGDKATRFQFKFL